MYTVEDLQLLEQLQKNYPNVKLRLSWYRPLHDEDGEECPSLILMRDEDDYGVIVANPRLGYEFCEKMLKDLLTNL